MSGFTDIARAYSSYASTGDWGSVSYDLIYACNVGWLDRGDPNQSNARGLIGISNLWAAVRSGGISVKQQNCTVDGQVRALVVGGLAYSGWNACRCDGDEFVRFSDDSQGILVRYRRDQAGDPGEPCLERHYVVEFQLNEAQLKSVALSIFMDVSRPFEWLQRLAGLSGLITDNRRSQEDFVSNHLGFYIAITEMNTAQEIGLAHPVRQATALWKTYGTVEATRNYTFRPHLLNAGRDDTNLRQCVDKCARQLRQFPAEFQTIQPVEQGSFHMPYQAGPTMRF